jgi:hypothetical protein
MSKLFRVIEGSHFEGNVEYTKDQVVESSRNLVDVFPGKFVEISAQIVQPMGVTPPVSVVDKIRQVDVQATQSPASVVAPVVEQGDESAAHPYGADVTSQFKIARRAKLTVRKRGGKFFVFESSDDDAPLNKKGLASIAVESFVEDHVDGSD